MPILFALALPSFTIIGESQQPVVVPSLAITQMGSHIVITGPDPNQIFGLESSSGDPMVFQPVDAPVSFSNNHRSVTLPQRTDGNWFFRLHHRLIAGRRIQIIGGADPNPASATAATV